MDNEKLATALEKVANAGLAFINETNKLADEQFGKSVRTKAAEVIETMKEAGLGVVGDREALIDQLVYDKNASLNGLEQLSQRLAVRSIGRPGTMSSGSVKKAASDEIWENWLMGSRQ